MFQGEVSTTLGKDTILARYYHASIYRLLNEGASNYRLPVTIEETLNGTNSFGATYNNVTVPVDWYNYYYQSESDSLGGVDLQYQHPYGLGNTLTASVSHTNSTTSYWYQESATNYNSKNAFTSASLEEPDVSIPEGSGEDFTTIRLTDNQNFGEKVNALLSLYDNLYNFTAATTCGAGASSTAANACALNGSNATFRTTNPTHFDERLGLTYRPTTNLIFRGSVGSSIAPPYINLLSRFATLPSCGSPLTCPAVLTVAGNNPNLVPETSFGYDLGADLRIKRSYFLSADAYLTNLFNQFLLTTQAGPICTAEAFPGSNCPSASSGGPFPQIYYTLNGNVNNSRYEGIELQFRHVVENGVGFAIQGSTQRGYAYNLGTNFYCGFAAQNNPLLPGFRPCIPANYNQNLAVVAGQNFNGGWSNYVNCTVAPNPATYCAGANNVSNQSVPYLQGYAEINWQNHAGWFVSFGGTLFGKNNSYNEPPFTVARATLRAPLGNGFALQFSGNNIFNAYKQYFPVVGGGVPIPLINGGLAPTNGNVIGPATWNLVLSKKFGGTP
jgi:hypothetical protein